jgi:hypothetical protein
VIRTTLAAVLLTALVAVGSVEAGTVALMPLVEVPSSGHAFVQPALQRHLYADLQDLGAFRVLSYPLCPFSPDRNEAVAGLADTDWAAAPWRLEVAVDSLEVCGPGVWAVGVRPVRVRLVLEGAMRRRGEPAPVFRERVEVTVEDAAPKVFFLTTSRHQRRAALETALRRAVRQLVERLGQRFEKD